MWFIFYVSTLIQNKTHCESFYNDHALDVDGKSCEMLAKELADMLQSECLALYANGQLEADGKSCETLAAELAGILNSKYKRSITVEVNEDGECGAVVTYTLVGG